MKLFIHIPKNGGMTIRDNEIFHDKILVVNKHMIANFKNFRDTMKAYNERDTKGVEHARWRDVNPNHTSQHDAFAIVRNPWSKVVSRYLFAKQAVNRGLVKESYADTRSLEHFIEERHVWGNKDLTWYRAIRGWYPQLDHVTDDSGNVKCDILRLEHLDKDAVKYFNISEMPRARNVTSIKENYMDLYEPHTINIIADWYKKDIDYWDFDFDTSARKNTWIGKNID